MAKAELIFDQDCPNVPDARQNLKQALLEAGLKPEWTEHNRNDPNGPAYARQFGSPTILISGKDVAGLEAGDGSNCCRIYRDSEGRSKGVPSTEMIKQALAKSIFNGPSVFGTNGSGALGATAGLTGIGAVFLSGISCPACIPAWASIISAVGLGTVVGAGYLFPVAAVALGISIVGLGYQANLRRRYAPFWLGVTASFLVLVGRFYFESDRATYTGATVLIVAIVWNILPPKGAPICSPSGE